MNSVSFYTKVWVPKPGVRCKNGFMGMDEPFCPFDIISVGWMK
jgi:hypothetical protein